MDKNKDKKQTFEELLSQEQRGDWVACEINEIGVRITKNGFDWVTNLGPLDPHGWGNGNRSGLAVVRVLQE